MIVPQLASGYEERNRVLEDHPERSVNLQPNAGCGSLAQGSFLVLFRLRGRGEVVFPPSDLAHPTMAEFKHWNAQIC